MLRNVHIWLPSYLKNIYLKRKNRGQKHTGPCALLFTICDHFEPFWANTQDRVAFNRVKRWVDSYQTIASEHKDFLGNPPQHCFYYPIEEYRKNLMEMITGICRNGFGEVEVHLHHDNDTPGNLRKTLTDYKNRLAEVHGLLSKKKTSSEVHYGFIHGNWALDNSRPDGRWCGVNNEITILQETGCYADFTMPSAPSNTQTSTINSVYYAVGHPGKPKSHNTGNRAIAGVTGQKGLLCIQGPLSLNPSSRKFGLIPRIENGELSWNLPPTPKRLKLWVDQQIHVGKRPDIIFVKLYTHGTQEKNMDLLFKEGALNNLFSMLEDFCRENDQFQLYYLSTRQMYNVVKGLEKSPNGSIESMLDFELKKNG